MHVGWIDGGVLIVPQSTQRPPSRPSISSAPRTNIALSGGTPIGMVSPAGYELAACPQHLGVRRRRARARARPRRVPRPATGVSTSTSTPVVRPPPVPTIATRPGASSAPIAPSNAAAAPVSPTALYDRGRRGRTAADLLGDDRAEAAVGVGERPRAHVERRERGRSTSATIGRKISSRNRRGVVEVAVVDPRRRRGSGRGTGGCA